VRSALGLWCRFVFRMVVNEGIRQRGLQQGQPGRRGTSRTRLVSDHCELSVSQISNFPTSSIVPLRGNGQQGSASRSGVFGRMREADRGREKCAQQRGGLVFAAGVRLLEGGGASPPLRGPISAPVSPRRT
jgi:hypothetical protein